MSAALADHAHRQQALDTSDSYIVQAPAGSGKTELLSLRFLKLLALCEQPEQVLAITFTRKAANEMSERIIAALRWASHCLVTGTTPDSELERARLAIARQVLAQDETQDWHLLQNPARLRVQTIDSFCHYLASQLPVQSQLGGNAQISDDVTPCFIDAISNTLAQLETDSPISDDVAALLIHLDNDTARVERLLVNMLKNRDQWLGPIMEIRASFADAREYLRQGIEELIAESLQEAHAGLLPVADTLAPLLNYAAENLQAADYPPHDSLPAPVADELPAWQFLVNTLLTKEIAWRKQVTVNNGFPPGEKSDKAQVAACKAAKETIHGLLADLAGNDDLLASLHYLRLLPDPHATNVSFEFLAALTRVLAHLSTELLLSFRKYRVVDYTQTSSAARTALGSEDAPTDLALALDHRIQHVLVDEFQDTSQMQLEILQQLTAGWQPGDGRTLFLVGDAMQSCYAFRNANVGIYLKVKASGLGQIPLTPLTLQTNFRSQARVVDWVNRRFATAFPRSENISRGAVPYSASVAMHPARMDLGVEVKLLVHDREQSELARQAEAAQVVSRIQHLQQHHPGQSIAVLVRARPHLNHLIPALRAAGIEWQSTDIDPLNALPIVEDLLSLTRALLNKADRLSWLALLRAPWCGLAINDLHAVAQQADGTSIWQALQTIDGIERLTPDARARLHGIFPVLAFAMHNRFRLGLRSLLEHCWHLLGGSSLAQNGVELASVARFLDLVSEHETAGGLIDIEQFEQRVAAAFVPGTGATQSDTGPGIHLLTMHKAKGLEFDHVVLPGLARLPRSDDKPLLQWHDRLNQAGQSRLFLATLSASGADEDALYALLRYEQQFKSNLEDTRLLYIAVTRARTSVQLIATLVRKSKGELEPPRASLLRRIWRELGTHAQGVEEIAVEEMVEASAAPATSQGSTAPSAYPVPTPIRRLAEPLANAGFAQLAMPDYVEPELSLPQATLAAHEDATLGTLIHRSLEALGRAGVTQLEASRLRAMREYWQCQLRGLAGSDTVLQQWLRLVETQVTATLQNPALQWLYQPNLQANEFEVALSRRQDGRTRMYKIDRSVIDADGTRWIIDYKTGLPGKDESEDDFIAIQRERHSAQLENYRDLYRELDGERTSQRIRCALLFTGLGKLVELD